MAGCERDPVEAPEPEEQQITINFAAGELAGSLLKKDASSEEDLIEKIILYGVNAQHEVVDTIILASSGKTRSIRKTVKTIWAIANPTDDLLAVFPADSTALMGMTVDFSTAPQSPLQMSGKVKIGTANSVTILFYRIVSRIDLVGIADKFQIESVKVNTAATGYVFERPSLVVPASTWVEYSYTGTAPVIYVAEHLRTNAARFTVTGRFLNQPAHLQQLVESNPFSITSGGQIVDIKRNTYYQVKVGFEWN